MHPLHPISRATKLCALLALSSCVGAPSHHETVNPSATHTSHGAHVGGLRNGPWTEFYASGRKQSEGAYENDVQAGVWTYWFENGNKEMEGRFADERREGEWKLWYSNGALRAQGRFERGFEEGPWRFYDESGALDHAGVFELGAPVLRWTYFRPDGSVRATGAYDAGVRVGEWITRDAAGNETRDVYPLPTGCEWVEELFDDAKPKRSGFVRDGVPVGRWVSHHRSGALRMECNFRDGAPNGRARAWRDDGTLLARGELNDGCLVGEWTFWRGSAPETIDVRSARPRQSFSGEWSDASSAEQLGLMSIETWVAELCAPRQPAPMHETAASARPIPESTAAASHVVAAEEVSSIPARAQPWTEYETRALSELVKRYGSGKIRNTRDEEDWDATSPRARGAKRELDVASAADLLGRTLPLKRFTTADGGRIDLDDYLGKRNVLVTILRGFGGQVCVYCAAQTKGLADFADAFDALDTEVVVVYPGPATGLTAFLEAYRRTFDVREKLPYKLLYDTGLGLTRALHIEDNIAVPTSILLDRKGIIRWCHVARDYADRPSAQQVLDQISALAKKER